MKVSEWHLETARIAKQYNDLLKERAGLEKEILFSTTHTPGGMPRNPAPSDPAGSKAIRLIRERERLNKLIEALQGGLEDMRDDTERKLIRQNLFQRIPMRWVNLPMSIITMKRIRKRYLRNVARRLYGEISGMDNAGGTGEN